MSVHDQTIEKIRQLPESLAREVDDFVDFLLNKYSQGPNDANNHESSFVEADITDYLQRLNDYEEQLARGEIQW